MGNSRGIIVKICIVVGTRPEIIKMAPIVIECKKRGLDFFIIHSNQHYSESMDKVIFNDFSLPPAKYNLEVGSGKHSNQTGNILIKIEPVLEKEKPDVILVQGDTNTVLAAGMAGSKLGIKVGHVEAGLRSYDKSMPEETNRVVVDHLADYLFAVSDLQEGILKKEGLSSNKIFTVGNTVVDALLHAKLRSSKSNILTKNGLKPKDYILSTLHRSGNVDNVVSLTKILEILSAVHKKTDLQVLWPIHPRSELKIKEFNLKVPSGVKLIEPCSYLDFIQLESSARLILTDSGGVQEEACILNIPCVTLRENTERPETLHVGANRLVGLSLAKTLEAIDALEVGEQKWINPFGDGNTAKKIIDIVLYDRVLNNDSRKNVCVIGLGYMGLPIACLISNAGHKVVGVDLSLEKIDLINSQKPPFEEDGLEALLKSAIQKNEFYARRNPIESDIFLIAVPTPVVDRSCDLSYVVEACKSILGVVKNGDLIIIESTIKPGVCEDVILPIFKEVEVEVMVSHCPERAIPGNTLHELIHNDRIVGGLDTLATELTADFYASFVRGKVLKTNAKTAEICKLMENTYRDVNIALSNEFEQICTNFGVDAFEAIKLANKHPRVSILNPGPGVGGHCIAVDPWFLIEDFSESKIIKSAREINEARPLLISKRIKEKINYDKKKTICLLGVAYKGGVDDDRESPSYIIGDDLENDGYHVTYHDPFVSGSKVSNVPTQYIPDLADFHVLLTDHNVYQSLSLKNYYCTKNLLPALKEKR